MSKRCAKIAFVQADDPRSNLRVPNRVDWVSECCRLLAEDDEDVYFISSGTVSEYDVEVREGIEHPHRRFPWSEMGFSSEQKYSDEFHLTREGLEAWSPHVCEFVIGFAEHVGCESALIEADSTLAAHD